MTHKCSCKKNEENKKHNNCCESDDAQKEQESLKKQKKDDKSILQKKLKETEKELEKYKQIASNTQNQYVTLKRDFDAYIKRTDDAKKRQEWDMLIETAKKFIPFVEELRKTIENIPEDMQDNWRVKWVELLYQNCLKNLEKMNIYQVNSIWKPLDENYHEPIWGKQDSQNSGNIVDEMEKLYIYRDWQSEEVIQPAKVIVAT